MINASGIYTTVKTLKAKEPDSLSDWPTVQVFFIDRSETFLTFLTVTENR